MKRIFILVNFLFISFVLSAQKTFESEIFSFTYPSTYKSLKIENAPHMVLKLDYNEGLFSISNFDRTKELNESTDIWNDVYNIYNGWAPKGSNFVSIDKYTLNIKSGKERCLRLKTNSIIKGVKIKNIIYIILYDKTLLVFNFLSAGTNTPESSTEIEDNIMKGLRLKQNTKEDISQHLINSIKQLNQQCPIHPNEFTTINNVILIGNTIAVYIVIDNDFINYFDIDKFKKNTISALKKALSNSIGFKQEIVDKYRMNYFIFNSDGEMEHLITIQSSDVYTCVYHKSSNYSFLMS